MTSDAEQVALRHELILSCEALGRVFTVQDKLLLSTPTLQSIYDILLADADAASAACENCQDKMHDYCLHPVKTNRRDVRDPDFAVLVCCCAPED